MDIPTTPDVLPIAGQSETAQPKSNRPTSKQRKSDLEDYRKAYFAPVKLGKDNKHQVAISNDSFDRVERIARIFGGPGYSVGGFIEHIVNGTTVRDSGYPSPPKIAVRILGGYF